MFRLALRLGTTVANLENELPAREFFEWIEFFNLEPFGWEAECYRAGIVAATIANVNRDTKKRARPFDASEFVPGAHERKQIAKIDGKKLKAQLIAAYAGHFYGRRDQLQDNGRKGTGKKAPRSRPRRGDKDRG